MRPHESKSASEGSTQIKKDVPTQSQVPDPRPLYSKKESAYQFSISLRSLNYLISDGRINVRRIGGRVLIPHYELLRFSRHDRHELLVPEKAQPK
jgi:hypothetical protein